MADERFPETLQINAWCGESGTGKIGSDAARWGIKRDGEPPKRYLPAEEPPDFRDWQDPRVGWGIVLPENEALEPKQRSTVVDAPEPIRALVAHRNDAPVFRYRADSLNLTLRRYAPDGVARDISFSGGERGIGVKALPWYLLIAASPKKIPWALQYTLHQACFVGRLDLEGTALENYVNAALTDWRDATCRPDRPLVWSVNHGHPDITWLMHGAIAKPVHAKLAGDTAIGDEAKFVTGDSATVAVLKEHLKERTPALIVTTSHGMTGPLDDAALMSQQLGYLVDAQRRLAGPDELLSAWQPDGAIWYAHACCSAGSDSYTSYEGLVEPGSNVERILQGVAALGAHVAPLPTALLGAAKPLRAFVGHVEPTFDWTLRATTGQVLTSTLCNALYDRMHRKRPDAVALAFHQVHRHAGELLVQHDDLRRQVARAVDGASVAATRTRLAALDRQSMVILGDPVAALPALSP